MAPASADASTDLDLRALARALLEPRVIEEKMLTLIRRGRIAKWFSGYGQEGIAVGTTWALDDRDYILPMHRNFCRCTATSACGRLAGWIGSGSSAN